MPPSLLGSPPRALVLATEPQLHCAPHRPVHFMEGPVTVPDSEIGAPPIQNGVQLLDHQAQRPISTETTAPLRGPAGGCGDTPYRVATLTTSASVLSETQNPEMRSLPPAWSACACLGSAPRQAPQTAPVVGSTPPRLSFRPRQQYHVVRITDQSNLTRSEAIAPAPLTVHLMQKDVGQQG